MTVSPELAAALVSTRALFGAAACSCALTSDDGAGLTFVAADGAGADKIVGVSIPVNKGIAGWVALSGQPTAIADVARDERFARDVAESTDYVPTSILAAPLLDADGEVLGVLEVLDPSRSGDSALGGQRGAGVELAVLAVVASQIAAVIGLSGELETSRGAADADLAALVAGLGEQQVPLARALLEALTEHGTR